MKRVLSFSVMVVLMLSFMGSTALAGSGYGGHGKGEGHVFYPGMLKKLNLTADQEKKFAGLKVALKKVAAPAKAEIEIKYAELKTLWMAEKPLRSAILAKQAEIAAAKKKIKTASVDFHLGALKIFTKDQKKIVRSMLGKGGHYKGHYKGHGHGKGHGEPPCKHGH